MLSRQQFRSSLGERARTQAAFSGGRFNGRGASDRGLGTGRSEGDYGVGTGVAVESNATSDWADFGEADDFWRRLS